MQHTTLAARTATLLRDAVHRQDDTFSMRARITLRRILARDKRQDAARNMRADAARIAHFQAAQSVNMFTASTDIPSALHRFACDSSIATLLTLVEPLHRLPDMPATIAHRKQYAMATSLVHDLENDYKIAERKLLHARNDSLQCDIATIEYLSLESRLNKARAKLAKIDKPVCKHVYSVTPATKSEVIESGFAYAKKPNAKTWDVFMGSILGFQAAKASFPANIKRKLPRYKRVPAPGEFPHNNTHIMGCAKVELRWQTNPVISLNPEFVVDNNISSNSPRHRVRKAAKDAYPCAGVYPFVIPATPAVWPNPYEVVYHPIV